MRAAMTSLFYFYLQSYKKEANLQNKEADKEALEANMCGIRASSLIYTGIFINFAEYRPRLPSRAWARQRAGRTRRVIIKDISDRI